MNEPTASRSEPWRRRLRRLLARGRGALPFAWGVAAALAALLLYRALVPGPRQLTTREVDVSVAQALASATVPPAPSARVYQAIRPSFVLIQTQAPGANGKTEHRALFRERRIAGHLRPECHGARTPGRGT